MGQRRRRWANIKTSLFQRVVFAGYTGDPRVHGVGRAPCLRSDYIINAAVCMAELAGLSATER